jgi:hypothetical protein
VEDGRQQARRLAQRLATCRIERPAHALLG